MGARSREIYHRVWKSFQRSQKLPQQPAAEMLGNASDSELVQQYLNGGSAAEAKRLFYSCRWAAELKSPLSYNSARAPAGRTACDGAANHLGGNFVGCRNPAIRQKHCCQPSGERTRRGKNSASFRRIPPWRLPADADSIRTAGSSLWEAFVESDASRKCRGTMVEIAARQQHYERRDSGTCADKPPGARREIKRWPENYNRRHPATIPQPLQASMGHCAATTIAPSLTEPRRSVCR